MQNFDAQHYCEAQLLDAIPEVRTVQVALINRRVHVEESPSVLDAFVSLLSGVLKKSSLSASEQAVLDRGCGLMEGWIGHSEWKVQCLGRNSLVRVHFSNQRSISLHQSLLPQSLVFIRECEEADAEARHEAWMEEQKERSADWMAENWPSFTRCASYDE